VKKLEVVHFGTDVQGIRLHGDPKVRPEPEHVRIAFPGGDVEVVRTMDGDYWVHVRVDEEKDTHAGAEFVGRVVDGRVDIRGRHASECDAGDLGHPDVYHLAVRVARR
jgi:hypothetical protein